MNAYEMTNEYEYLELAELYSDHLVGNGHSVNDGQIAWKYSNSNHYLGGLSHGTSGIAMSLFRLAHITKKGKYHDTAEKALRFDQSLFNVKKGAWKDNRQSEEQYFHQWCHGSVGIGLSRIALSDYTSNQLVETEIKQAIQNLQEGGIKPSDSLFHLFTGLAGIGLQLLRLSNPNRVPAVLPLD